MRWVRGKRNVLPQEDIYGILRVRVPEAGVQAVYFVWGKRAWGVNWKLKKTA